MGGKGKRQPPPPHAKKPPGPPSASRGIVFRSRPFRRPPRLLPTPAIGRIDYRAEQRIPVLGARLQIAGELEIGRAIPILIQIPPLYLGGPVVAQGSAFRRSAALHFQRPETICRSAIQRPSGDYIVAPVRKSHPGAGPRRIRIVALRAGRADSADIGIAGRPGAGNKSGLVLFPSPGIDNQITGGDPVRIAGQAGISQGAVRILFAVAQGGPGRLAPPFLLLPGKLKDAVDANPGNAGFPLGQPALLGGDETAELAALPEINGVIPFIAVFARLPGFSLGKGIGLVDAAIEGLAPVFGQGLEDGRGAVGVVEGLPVGAVPGDGTGLSCGCPPPLLC